MKVITTTPSEPSRRSAVVQDAVALPRPAVLLLAVGRAHPRELQLPLAEGLVRVEEEALGAEHAGSLPAPVLAHRRDELLAFAGPTLETPPPHP